MDGFSAISALLVILISSVAKGQVAVANFNAKGVSGSITFTMVPDGIRIQTNLQGLTGDHQWHVHLFPIDQTVDPNVQCTGDYMGPHYDPFNRNNDTAHGHGGGGGHGATGAAHGDDYATRCAQNPVMCEAGDLSGKFGLLSPSRNMDVVDNTSSLFLRGRYSVVGRSVVIHEASVHNANFECANIQSTNEINGSPVTVLQSTFVNPIAGVMYLKQVEGEEVQMWGKVFWVNGMGDTVDHNWHIHQLSPGEEFRMGRCNTSGNIGGHYDPFGRGPTSASEYSAVCGPDMVEGCEVGDLTGKHATINVADTPSPYANNAFFFTDSFLNLTGTYTVADRSIAIHQANREIPVVACAPLIASETITLRQYGEGEVSISQTSPFEDTVITSSNNREMTVIQKSALTPVALDCTASTNFVFSEYTIPFQEKSATPDRFLTGDLNGRYPNINGILSSQRVFDLPVYGANSSISSLNLRTARSNQNNCSALIVSLMESNVIIAKASFSGKLRGAIYFIQRDYGSGMPGSDKLGNTFVIVDIYRTNEASSSGHVWRVTAGGVPSTGCSASPSVFNPYSINTAAGTGCSPQAQLRCASGDLSGKHGTISITSDVPTRPTYTFVDNNILLTGSFSAIGNSVSVWDNSGVMDCGTVAQSYVSKESISFIASRDSAKTRSAIVSILAKEIEVDVSDIMVLRIRTTEPFGLSCTEVTVRTLGTSQISANGNLQMLNDKRNVISEMIKCDGALKSTVVSVVAMAMPILLALFHLVFQ